MNEHTPTTQQATQALMHSLTRLEGCVNGGHGADAVSMCIDMMQTELDLALEQHPDMDTSDFDAIIGNAIDVYNRLLGAVPRGNC